MIILSIICTLIFLISWVKFQQYEFLERDYKIVNKYKEYSKKWHFWKGVNQFIFFFVIYICFGYKIALINLSIYWILFDALFNKLVLKREFFYIGTTSTIDVTIQGLSKILKINPYFLSMILKLSLIILSIYIFI